MKSKKELTIITWLSFGLLLLTCLHFGWFLFESHLYFIISGIILALIWAVDLFFTIPLNFFQNTVLRWIRTDLGTFLMIVFLSILGVFMITWLQISINILLMLSATALARLELQTSRFSNWQSFIILSILSTFGLILGWALNYYFSVDHLEFKFCFPFDLGCIEIPHSAPTPPHQE
ncbi:hypothetical protein PCC9214_03963 [Planktothrix tepida]|uniref:Uncharacterized protein n=2 Tax=Planktothrix TaxID=54304 RepID=A0A1J1LQY4_9CYAN|nr:MULTISPECIES: hypothetical protein [Planktothrix]CAD5937191.1 hypothetical protein NO713_01676 [Planktothrix pseudagardhii]CAD5973194.1 hypothetical protein PCC9214_03963 [Planktothrix tepida]CUR34426.1 conserved membrane hypothetical protein [Planktothrix tepida PCC 9214]